MKITKCDRCGKTFEPLPTAMISTDGINIIYPLKLTYVIDLKELDICGDCQESLNDWLYKFKNGGESMDA